MGLTHHQHAEKWPEPRNSPTVPAAEVHLIVEDATIGNEERLRGIPAVGRVSGTIKGTRPGDSAKALADEARQMTQHERMLAMQAARESLKRPHKNNPE